MKATEVFLQEIEQLSQRRKQEIRSTPDRMEISGTKYYVSNLGDDQNDGISPETPWKTLEKVSSAPLLPGDGVCFRRGDLFRGWVDVKSGVTYCAYGEGEKPKFYGWDYDLAAPDLWTLVDEEHHIWKLNDLILDSGTLVFNHGEAHCRKLIPSYIHGQFVCRNDHSKPFVMAQEMTQDLDLFCRYDAKLVVELTKGEDFPIPEMDTECYGDLYLRCDKGNPGEVFSSIEALPRRPMFQVGAADHVTIDNLCMKYIGVHAVAAWTNTVKSLHVSNCEIGWIGGTIQHYGGTDPNYPQGVHGSVTRFGNGIEVYGGCDDYLVENCYIYQAYDAGITHQVSTYNEPFFLQNICYRNNLVEYCVYSIEYFLDENMSDTGSYINNCEIHDNILRFSGYGWGQQRHNTDTPAHIKGWSYENTAQNFSIHDNIFDRAGQRMIHLVAEKPESCPDMARNTYIQDSGKMIGQYGANEVAEPPITYFDGTEEHTITEVYGEKDAKVYCIE